MECYDYNYLEQVKELFGVTDYWVTYSWGFSDKTEQEDREFILQRLDNFKKLDIRVHAYIQGPNLVYDEFKDTDWWALDEYQRLVPYYRGRRVCSIHNQDYVDYVVNKIENTYGLGFDGIYIDNIQHGQLGIPNQPGELPFVFCGDYSQAAQADFYKDTGSQIPRDLEADPELTNEYLQFRVRANTRFIKKLSEVTHAGNMEFGSNFYDPKFDPTYIYAIDLKEMTDVQDYILFENHSLPTDNGDRHNGYIEELIEEWGIDKDVFVVSYENGVGMSPQFTQNQIDNLFSEAENANFNVCLKGGEFTTNGIWHSLYLDDLQTPQSNKVLPRKRLNLHSDMLQFVLQFAWFRSLVKRHYNRLYYVAFEWRICRFLVRLAYDTTLK